MQLTSYDRVVFADGAVQLASSEGRFAFRQPRAGTLLVTVSGRDHGQFGQGALDEIGAWLTHERQLALFIDARAVSSIAMSVQHAWTRFLQSHREQLRVVHIVAESKIVRLTIAIASHRSRTGSLIRLHERSVTFERCLRRVEH